VYTRGFPHATSQVLEDNTTDHHPVLTTIESGGVHKHLIKINCQHFKAIRRDALESALSQRDWSGIYAIKDVDVVNKFVVDGIIAALDVVAPVKEIIVKTGSNLYLKRETLKMMKRRDSARDGRPRFCALRNTANRLVKRDKLASNAETLAKASRDPRVLWQLANNALGKAPPSLPPGLVNATGSMTSGKREAAETINPFFFFSKVDSLQAASESADMASNNTHPARETDDSAVHANDQATDLANLARETAKPMEKTAFEFTFATAGQIAKIICGLKSTEAMGIDDIPTSILKKGVEVLAGLISHLVNRSLAKGRVSEAFKVSKVFPVYKGKGKVREDPASYPPVSILPAMSKVLETSIKADLERHLDSVNGLPRAQYGFRPKRSCTSALAQAHTGWLTGAEREQVVGIMAFDLSAAFDTVAAEQLLPKLQSLRVTGRALAWFESYLTGGSQQVSWDGTPSKLIAVRYGVRQGSILGPVLFLVLISNMAKALRIGDDENVVYADVMTIWQAGKTVTEGVDKLTEKAARFAEWSRGSGLTMNASKTQLLLSANAGSYGCDQLGKQGVQPGDGLCRPGEGSGQLGKGCSQLGKGDDHSGNVSVMVNGKMVKAEASIELLGVSFDRKLTTKPHPHAMLVAVKQRAAVIARLVNHIPRGKYLWQLAMRLVNRKLGHALAAYATHRLPAPSGEAPSTLYHQIQVAYNRVGRSITGIKIRDRVSVPDLLERAGIPSVDGMVVNTVAMETWNCRHSSDGGNGAKNFVGALIFDQGKAVKTTCAAVAGMAVVPLRGRETFVSSGARMWNSSEALREATSKSSARLAAKNLAARSPL
jgi:hypothetical protein